MKQRRMEMKNLLILLAAVVACSEAAEIRKRQAIDCALVRCAGPAECDPSVYITPPGECCPICPPPNCELVLCALPVCVKGDVIETPPGQCCPVCTRPDCAAVLCFALTDDDCPEDQSAVVPPGECCAVCQLDCSVVSCLRPVCKEGQMLVVPKGQCCPVCVEDCQYEGQEYSFCPGCDSTCIDAINEDFKFCPAVCIPGCGCPGGQLIDTAARRCVPRDECTNPCASISCPMGSMCRINGQGRGFCTTPSCDNNGGCAKDEICQLQQLQCVTAPCPEGSFVRCLSQNEVCSLPSVTGPCEALFSRYFFNSESGQCEKFTYGGCQGNANNFESLEDCQNFCGTDPCNGHECPVGSACQVFKPTGELFCVPDCQLDNGGCLNGQECSIEEVVCVRAPCPPIAKCTDTCATVKCSTGHRCEIDKPSGRAFCMPDCDLSNGGCDSDEICTLEQLILCFTTPCPPSVRCLTKREVCSLPVDIGPCDDAIPRYYFDSERRRCRKFSYGGCVGNANNFETRADCRSACGDPCNGHECPIGSACQVFTLTGEPFCVPDCRRRDNGGCRSDQICTLNQVQCIRAPCPPVVQCDCPPECSRDFCHGNGGALCSNPGPREIPGCTGACQLSYCNACIYSSDAIIPPANTTVCDHLECEDPRDYSKPSRCYKRWSGCVGYHYWIANRPSKEERNSIKCIRPDCPFKG